MRITLGERTLAMVLVVPTALAVIMLAIVQYRWSEEVRSATSVRLADSLQMSMMSWHLNLFRDLSDICLRMRLDSNHLGGQELEQTVRRFQEQQASADYRDVVSGINLVAVRPAIAHPAVEPDRPALRTRSGFTPRGTSGTTFTLVDGRHARRAGRRGLARRIGPPTRSPIHETGNSRRTFPVCFVRFRPTSSYLTAGRSLAGSRPGS